MTIDRLPTLAFAAEDTFLVTGVDHETGTFNAKITAREGTRIVPLDDEMTWSLEALPDTRHVVTSDELTSRTLKQYEIGSGQRIFAGQIGRELMVHFYLPDGSLRINSFYFDTEPTLDQFVVNGFTTAISLGNVALLD